ncbi:hypothetical protein GH714_031865 [Hevea brasiliensis]|uniref:Uncharacterized protein n=1 Tax=Hevea brasiliensis TaxID=3981 RepID=A0A6A6L1J8_HEVBR|nr:hypothetical protein GH714_031865 [Hevea brasiliensis]
MQGLMEHHKDIVEYFNARGVSAIFLFRRNLLRWMVSVLSNSYDRHAKLLNGMHKSHVHSAEEAETLSKYKPTINCTLLIADLKEMEIMAARALECFNNTRHIVLYSEDLVKKPHNVELPTTFWSPPAPPVPADAVAGMPRQPPHPQLMNSGPLPQETALVLDIPLKTRATFLSALILIGHLSWR